VSKTEMKLMDEFITDLAEYIRYYPAGGNHRLRMTWLTGSTTTLTMITKECSVSSRSLSGRISLGMVCTRSDSRKAISISSTSIPLWREAGSLPTFWTGRRGSTTSFKTRSPAYASGRQNSEVHSDARGTDHEHRARADDSTGR